MMMMILMLRLSTRAPNCCAAEQQRQQPALQVRRRVAARRHRCEYSCHCQWLYWTWIGHSVRLQQRAQTKQPRQPRKRLTPPPRFYRTEKAMRTMRRRQLCSAAAARRQLTTAPQRYQQGCLPVDVQPLQLRLRLHRPHLQRGRHSKALASAMQAASAKPGQRRPQRLQLHRQPPQLPRAATGRFRQRSLQLL